MRNAPGILRVYCNVVNYEMARHSVKEDDVRTAVRRVKDAYLPKRERLLKTHCSDRCNTLADCCAYLHLYAPLHTAMAYDIMSLVLSEMREWFRTFLSSLELLKMCSLGGGPGADVIGVVTALQSEFGCFYTSARIVDKIFDWKFIFESTIDEITSGCCGDVGRWLNCQYFEWSYITTNLLRKIDQDVDAAIRDTDVIIMSKFISAVASQNVPGMIKDIFKRMRPGAILLYIDNDGGGHHKIVSTIASECHLVPLLRPLQHQQYRNEALRINRFGSWSCCETRITVQIMEKKYEFPPVWNHFPLPKTETNWDLDLRNFSSVPRRKLRYVDKHSNTFERRMRRRRNKYKMQKKKPKTAF
ncbi:hypothetical protein AVEN_79108-1 [Araneus ventricosus]|uniref:Uncharacterized protein n=1 Tax=Araneus ventricosus TaxID=182803 RepID=A0A4Y2IKU6_ARAVE|nr:hypothetical protein AVEN_79108-1 [Araneus ventricosus]